MSTRSAIIEKLSDGTFRGIYCHFDGYVEGVGAKLVKHYTTPEQVKALIDLGDLSSLGERSTPIGPHKYGAAEEGTTVAYGRDRGESDVAPKKGPSVQAVRSQIDHQYAYLFQDGQWVLANNMRPIAELIGDSNF